jgi:hypothetical protein
MMPLIWKLMHQLLLQCQQQQTNHSSSSSSSSSRIEFMQCPSRGPTLTYDLTALTCCQCSCHRCCSLQQPLLLSLQRHDELLALLALMQAALLAAAAVQQQQQQGSARRCRCLLQLLLEMIMREPRAATLGLRLLLWT